MPIWATADEVTNANLDSLHNLASLKEAHDPEQFLELERPLIGVLPMLLRSVHLRESKTR